jgi:hypothetical protein
MSNRRASARVIRPAASRTAGALHLTDDDGSVDWNDTPPRGDANPDAVILLAFAPLHKAALGAAVAIVCATGFALLTLADLAIDPHRRAGLDLLGHYFYGYSTSLRGAAIAFFWGGVVGFVAGWFVAFARNVVMALWLLYVRARADWVATSNFLDHI